VASETALVPTSPTAQLAVLGEETREYIEEKGKLAKATLRAYAADWKEFNKWMSSMRLRTLPSDSRAVARYLVHLARSTHDANGRPRRPKVACITRVISSIAYYHRESGFEWFIPPEVKRAMKSIRRDLKVAQTKKQAITLDVISAMIPVTKCVRDRAILLVGLFGAFRRSEIAAITYSHVHFVAKGLEIWVQSSKTDQEGKGEWVGVSFASDPKLCPVRAMRAHLDESGIVDGPVFRNRWGKQLSPAAIAEIVQKTAKAAGIDSDFAAHSLRSGHATIAGQKGKSEAAIMRQGRWKNVAIVRGYYRNATLFDDNSSTGIA
jgi:integrase